METITGLPARGLAALRDREGGVFHGLALVVGIAVGFGAATLIWVLEGVEAIFHFLGDILAGGGDWFVLVSVPLGILAAWWIARRLSLIHISEPTRPPSTSRMPSSA